ncbi:hypothetical protein [Streptomyces gobiensis]|uniref:hypothetical protein n=1 Tax=Streptomyces gobiensis TaxID=2875706 RepID=UPI001E4AF286|nr:hypothetical protein [Streptomyces gobiensis]UGY94767.1 hypothetical protein test1122_25545 [Streptomyces gobiensis]
MKPPTRLAAAALTTAALLFMPAAQATTAVTPLVPADEPYLFTQQHRDDLWWWNGTWLPQTVPSGARVQIQLPGGPARWKPYTGPRCHPTGAARLLPMRANVTNQGTPGELPSEGRIDVYDNLQTFDYTVTGTGPAAICLRADPEPERPEDIGLDTGSPLTYVLTLLVGIPQTSLSSPL